MDSTVGQQQLQYKEGRCWLVPPPQEHPEIGLPIWSEVTTSADRITIIFNLKTIEHILMGQSAVCTGSPVGL